MQKLWNEANDWWSVNAHWCRPYYSMAKKSLLFTNVLLIFVLHCHSQRKTSSAEPSHPNLRDYSRRHSQVRQRWWSYFGYGGSFKSYDLISRWGKGLQLQHPGGDNWQVLCNTPNPALLWQTAGLRNWTVSSAASIMLAVSYFTCQQKGLASAGSTLC